MDARRAPLRLRSSGRRALARRGEGFTGSGPPRPRGPRGRGISGRGQRGGPPREERTPARSDDVTEPECASARARPPAGPPLDARHWVCACALPLGLRLPCGCGVRSLGSCKLQNRGLASQAFLLKLSSPRPYSPQNQPLGGTDGPGRAHSPGWRPALCWALG